MDSGQVVWADEAAPRGGGCCQSVRTEPGFRRSPEIRAPHGVSRATSDAYRRRRPRSPCTCRTTSRAASCICRWARCPNSHGCLTSSLGVKRQPCFRTIWDIGTPGYDGKLPDRPRLSDRILRSRNWPPKWNPRQRKRRVSGSLFSIVQSWSKFCQAIQGRRPGPALASGICPTAPTGGIGRLRAGAEILNVPSRPRYNPPESTW